MATRDQTRISYVSCIGRQVLHTSTTWEAHRKGVTLTNGHFSYKGFPQLGNFY